MMPMNNPLMAMMQMAKKGGNPMQMLQPLPERRKSKIEEQQHNPLHEAWLASKLVLLVVYVMLGSFALKRARSQGARLACLLAALLCAAVMVMIARTRDPLGWLPF